MQRREWHILLKTRKHLGVDQSRTIVVRAAVHHPVTDGGGMDALFVAQPGGCRMQRRRHIRDVLPAKFAIDRLSPISATPAQPRTRADAVDLPLDFALQLSGGLSGEYLEFDAGGARIDDEDGIHHSSGGGQRRPGAARMRV